MGRSTVNQLIQRAKSMNEYNNSGVANDAVWVDFFNAALVSMVEELNIQEDTTLTHSVNAVHDLPDDYYRLISLTDVNSNEVSAYKDQGFNFDGGRSFQAGYNVKNKGAKQVMELPYMDSGVYTLQYARYPEILTVSAATTQKPEVPTVGETALCYKAITHALENNNQPGQARYFEDKYLLELEKINKASYRARGQ